MALLYHIFYRIAFLATALVHLWWNDLVKAAATVAVLCLSSSGQPLIQSILKLHTLVLICFVLGFCFNTVSAASGQVVLRDNLTILNFDDVQTVDGFAEIPPAYHDFTFDGLYAFDPTDPALEDKISLEDLNCAVSKPNALYGTREYFGLNAAASAGGVDKKPSIQPSISNATFTIHRLKIKPLNMPVGAAKVNLQGVRRRYAADEQGEVLEWGVDFPAGFHDTLDVRVREFSGRVWDRLEVLYMWADFHYNGLALDWEICADDIELEID